MIDWIYSDKAKIFFYLLIIFGGMLILSSVFREKIKSRDDLVNITAPLKNAGLYETRRRSRYGFSHSYTSSYCVRLKGYENVFKVYGDIKKGFDQDNFETNVLSGDTVTIQVSQWGFSKLNSDNIIDIFGISTPKATYLDYNLSIEEYNKKRYGFLGLIILATGIYLLRYTKIT